MELFDVATAAKEPLAARMRPRTLDEYVGQERIVGRGRLLRRAIAADRLTSVIFCGPPGSGKTTLARVIANHTKSNFITLNAVLTGVKDIRAAIDAAETQRRLYSRKTILFVDEVHRWNRSQQDALLPWVENGTIILVGATTENPFFEVNKALVSRSRVFQLAALNAADLKQAALAALADKERGYGRWQVSFESGALEHLIDTANGDARSLLNALELAVEGGEMPPEGEKIVISKECAEESIQRKAVLYDRDGDYHYDIISAFIKSLRGRDPDAAMYWLARMSAAGEDPHFIFRRMLISACEDTGLADPAAISVVESAARAFDRVGLPEGRYFLAHAALYLSTAPKSNSSMAFFDALASVEKEDADVPNHLRDASRDADGFGHGAGYMYPHAYRDHWVAQQYLPESLAGRVFYTPSSQGYEKGIRDEVLSRREAQIAALLERGAGGGGADDAEIPGGMTPNARTGKAEWEARTDSGYAESLLRLRREMTRLAGLERGSRVIVYPADDGLLIWDALRACTEGAVCGVCRSERGRAVLEQYGRTLSEIERPLLALENRVQSAGRDKCGDNTLSVQGAAERMPGTRGGALDEGGRAERAGESGAASPLFRIPDEFADIPFDRLFFRDIISLPEHIAAFYAALEQAERDGRLADGWRCVFAQRLPAAGQRLAALLREQVLPLRDREGGAARTSSSEARQRDGAHKAADNAPNGDFLPAGALAAFEAAENRFYAGDGNPLCAWNADTLQSMCPAAFSCTVETHKWTERRRLSRAEVERWFAPDSRYGGTLRALMDEGVHDGADALRAVAEALLSAADAGQTVEWKTAAAMGQIRYKLDC